MNRSTLAANRWVAALHVRHIRLAAFLSTYSFDRRLFSAYRFLESGKAVGAKSQPWRGYDIIRYLKAHRPKRIVEFGSGTSTAVFASFAASGEAEVLTFEQHGDWRTLTIEALSRSNLLSSRMKIEHVPAVETGQGSKFEKLPEGKIDFLYVDGPVTIKRGGKKLPCLDTLELFDRGIFPNVIMVDGRYDTVKAICDHPASKLFSVTYEYGMVKRLPMKRHSVFLKLDKSHP